MFLKDKNLIKVFTEEKKINEFFINNNGKVI
jgi:hypothetical protein